MDFSISTWNYLCSEADKADLNTAISEIKTDGFGLELWLDWWPDLQVFTRERWPRLKELTAGITTLSLHTALFGEKKYKVDDLTKEIDLGRYLGARILVLHVDTLDTIGLTKDQKGYQQVKEMIKYAEEKGVTLALENGPLSILRELVDACGIKVCFDIAHAHINFENSDLSSNSPMRFLDEFASEIVHLHFSDNDGYTDQHLVPGTGSIDWDQILARIKRMNFSGQCVLELKTDNARQSAQQAREYITNIVNRI